jgi:maltose/moltooligosaccharide transporter
MQKPHFSFWQIWNMCFGFLGVQFGLALQNANGSRIFQTLGANEHEIPILWVAAPLTGLIVQPIIGYFSDKTWNRMGRRRPYFFYGAIFTTLALVLMPNSPVLWFAAGVLWILDASINVTMEPFRAFIGDMLSDEQRTTGFAMQSFFIGVGSVIASILPYIFSNLFEISNTAPEGIVPPSVKFSFYIGGAVLFLAIMWTIFKTKEYPPEELEAYAKTKNAEKPSLDNKNIKRTSPQKTSKDYFSLATLWAIAGIIPTALIYYFGLAQELYILTIGLSVFGILLFMVSLLKSHNQTNNGFYEVMHDLFHMPRVMKQLAVVQFFSWFSLFGMWIYTTPAVTSFHFGSSDPTTTLYNEGADWVGILFGAYNLFAAIIALFIPKISNKLGRRKTHLINLTLGGLGLTSFTIIKDPNFLIFSMVGIGIAWASILSVPYSLLSSAVPYKKMGIYMGIFNFFIVIPQLLAASVMGLLVRHLFDGQTVYALAICGLSMILSGIAAIFVNPNGAKNEKAITF